MRYVLIALCLLVLSSPVIAGDYVTVTKNSDGTYSMTFSARGKVVIAEMERMEGGKSIETNTENLMRGWDRRIKQTAREAAVEEMKKIAGPMTPEQADKINKLLEKAR